MFDIGAAELLVIVVVAILVIGPKDMPMALRAAGRWIGKVRRMSNHFRAGIDNMIREAELEEAEKEWRERNDKVMRDHPDSAQLVREPENLLPDADMEPLPPDTVGDVGDPAPEAIAREAPSGGGAHASDPTDRVDYSGRPEAPQEDKG